MKEGRKPEYPEKTADDEHPEVPTLPFWAEYLPLYVISPVLPFDRKISR